MIFGLISLILAHVGSVSQPETAPTSRPATAPATRIATHVVAFVDLHYFVRSLLESGDRVNVPEDFAEAVDAARALEETLGGPLSWGMIEGNLPACTSAEQAVSVFSRLPETRRLRDEKTVEVRAPAVRLAEAYRAVEPRFLEKVWPDHRKTVEAAVELLSERLGPREAECIAFICDKLGMEDPQTEIPLYLVARAPSPQGFTQRRLGGGAVCFVAVERCDDALLCEIVLHEAIHALDVAAPSRQSVLAKMRNGMQEAGVGPESKLHREVAHTLIFVQAGETVRRLIDPKHEHYGDSRGYYAKVPQATEIVRPNWTEYLDGKISRDEAVKQIVAAATAPHEQKKP